MDILNEGLWTNVEKAFENILEVLEILTNDEEMLADVLECKGIDECYDFFLKIKSGYTKLEFIAFFDELKVLTTQASCDKIMLNKDLESISGGAKLNKINKKVLSVALSALTLTGTLPISSGYAESPYRVRQSSSKKEADLTKIKRGIQYGVAGAAVLGTGLALLNHVLGKTSSCENVNLTNLGATCFYDSLLQQLYSIKSFRQFVDDYDCGDLKFEDLRLNDITSDNILRYKMCAFKDLFKKMGNPEGTSVSYEYMEKFVDLTIKRKLIFEKKNEEKDSPKIFKVVTAKDYKDEQYPNGKPVYDKGQKDSQEAYVNYISDVVDEYEKHHKNICSSPLSFEYDTNLEQLLREGQDDRIKINTLLEKLAVDKETAFKLIGKYWDGTKTSRVQGQNVDLEAIGYANPLNDKEYNTEFQDTSENDLIDFCSKFRNLGKNEDDDKLLCILNPIKKLGEKMKNKVATDQEKYDFYVLCWFYSHKKHQIAETFLKEIEQEQRLPELLCKNTILDCKRKVFAMLSNTVGGKSMAVSQEYNQLLPADWNSQLDDIKRSSLRTVYDDKEFAEVRKECPLLKIEPKDGQFSFFVNRTGNIGKNNQRLDLGDGTLKNYYGKDYFLSAVTVHDGNGIFGGHYYVFKRSSEDDGWYKYNDLKPVIEKVDWQSVKAASETRCAMLTYTQKGDITQENPIYIALPSQDKVAETSQPKPQKADPEPKKVQEAVKVVWATQLRKTPEYFDNLDNQTISVDNVQIVTTYPKPAKGQYGGITDISLLKKISATGRTAIIDASNSSGLGGGGVDGAIFNAMGAEIAKSQLALALNGKTISDGGAIIHKSFNIWQDTFSGNPAFGVPFVVQSVAPNLCNKVISGNVYFQCLYSAYYNAFYLGAVNKVTTFMSPALGLGVFAGIKQSDKDFGRNCAKAFAMALADIKLNYPNFNVVFTDHQDDRSYDCTKAFFAALKEFGATDFE